MRLVTLRGDEIKMRPVGSIRKVWADNDVDDVIALVPYVLLTKNMWFSAGGGCLNYGFQAGWISPMQKLLQSDKSPSGTPLTDIEMTWVASLMPITGIFAGFFHMYCADAFGRRKTLIIAMIAQVVRRWCFYVHSPKVFLGHNLYV